MAVCLAQGGWQTAIDLPGVDFTGMSKASRDIGARSVAIRRCICGCDMKIAECRVDDPGCGVSRRFAHFVVREASAGKTAAAIREDLTKYANTPPPLLDEQAVKLSIDGDPMRGPANARVTIVEFSDFQCPFCAAATEQVKLLLQNIPNDVRLVFKQFRWIRIRRLRWLPRRRSRHRRRASSGSCTTRCMRTSGRFRVCGFSPGRRRLAWICPGSPRIWIATSTLPAVASEEKQGEVAGVEGTPTFYIDGHRLNATLDVATVAPLIAKK